jgi:hypothetical protein
MSFLPGASILAVADPGDFECILEANITEAKALCWGPWLDAICPEHSLLPA